MRKWKHVEIKQLDCTAIGVKSGLELYTAYEIALKVLKKHKERRA